MTRIIGVTGGIGSGKSALTDRLAEHGVVVVDADQAAREVVEPGQPALREIVDRFGPEVLLNDGALNRAALRQQVFNDDTARKDLEAITHPKIRETLQRQLNAATSPYVVLSSPLLLESGQVAMVEKVIVVDVPEATQIERTMRRDDNDEALVKRILAAQIPRAERLAAADKVIDNTGSLDDLRQAADDLHQQLLTDAL